MYDLVVDLRRLARQGGALPRATNRSRRRVGLAAAALVVVAVGAVAFRGMRLGEAHAAMAGLKFDDWDWTGAENEARRALESNYVDQYYASVLTITGRHDQAIAAAEHAAKIDPLSPIIQSSFGIVLYNARRYDDALSQLKRSIDLEPRNYAAMLKPGVVYEALGRPREALVVFDRPEFRESPCIARAYALLGRRDDALKVMNGLVKRWGDLQEMAIAYFVLGD
jgi:tetratricopeptide (TPR) repeat protein